VAPRRWLLLILAILSLVLLVGGVLSLAFSTTLSGPAADAARLPGEAEPHGGERVFALPIQDVTQVPTVVSGGNDTILMRPGALLVVADAPVEFPSSAANVSVVRALAYVSPGANGSYPSPTLQLANLTAVSGGNLTTFNASVEVTPLALGKAGFIVKADTADGSAIRFVAQERVLGQAALYVEPPQLLWLIVLSAAGFLAPIGWLILTHRPSGTRGIPGGVSGVTNACPECRAPLAPGSDFCTRCGAWLKEAKP
jgi:hypothetical protein